MPQPITVLVAEDDHAARGALSAMLGSLGHTVVAAVATGTEAAQEAERLTPDAALLDVHLADGCATNAAKAIAARVPGTAVVFLTGDDSFALSDEDVGSSAAAGFLLKPARAAALDAALRVAVSRTRALGAANRDAAAARAELESRKVIERAKGILMRRTGTTEQEAYGILRRTSQDRSVPMVEIARAVLESEPGFQPRPAGTGAPVHAVQRPTA